MKNQFSDFRDLFGPFCTKNSQNLLSIFTLITDKKITFFSSEKMCNIQKRMQNDISDICEL